MFEWAGAGIVGIVVGWFLKSRIGADQKQTTQSDSISLRRNVEEAENRYLEVLRREIGNILVNLDSDLMVGTYEKGWRYQDEVVKAGKEGSVANFLRRVEIEKIIPKAGANEPDNGQHRGAYGGRRTEM